jgi:hypothetical protein
MSADPGLDARVQAVAHLSAARTLVECADCALEEAGVPTPEWNDGPDGAAGLTLSSDAIYHLNAMADALMEPYEIARVLDTVEEVVTAEGFNIIPPRAQAGRFISRHGRAAIIHALIDTRAAAREVDAA